MNHCITIILEKPIIFIIIFTVEKITQHTNVTSHTWRQKIYKIDAKINITKNKLLHIIFYIDMNSWRILNRIQNIIKQLIEY